jgi:hypothetical protein
MAFKCVYLTRLAQGRTMKLHKRHPSLQSYPKASLNIQLWGTASNSNLEIRARFQSKALRMITDAPWYTYVPNAVIKRDLQIPTVKQEARTLSASYRKRLDNHTNALANTLLIKQPGTHRLKRLYPTDLVTSE